MLSDVFPLNRHLYALGMNTDAVNTVHFNEAHPNKKLVQCMKSGA